MSAEQQVPAVRRVRAADLKRLAAVEESGGALFEELLGDLRGDPLLAPARSGGERDDVPGFLLVAGPVGEPVGFVHVLDLEGQAHLEQLSVRPEHARRGLGSALVRAAMREARGLGHDRMSLCTYRDVAWNGPFYRRLGFTEVAEPEPWQRRIREHEQAIGLDRHGVRVVMQARLPRATVH